jgi:hypothetical protein
MCRIAHERRLLQVWLRSRASFLADASYPAWRGDGACGILKGMDPRSIVLSLDDVLTNPVLVAGPEQHETKRT